YSELRAHRKIRRSGSEAELQGQGLRQRDQVHFRDSRRRRWPTYPVDGEETVGQGAAVRARGASADAHSLTRRRKFAHRFRSSRPTGSGAAVAVEAVVERPGPLGVRAEVGEAARLLSDSAARCPAEAEGVAAAEATRPAPEAVHPR